VKIARKRVLTSKMFYVIHFPRGIDIYYDKKILHVFKDCDIIFAIKNRLSRKSFQPMITQIFEKITFTPLEIKDFLTGQEYSR